MVSCLSSACAIAILVPTPSVLVASSGRRKSRSALTSNSPAKPPTPPITSEPCVRADRRLHQLDGAVAGRGVDARLRRRSRSRSRRPRRMATLSDVQTGVPPLDVWSPPRMCGIVGIVSSEPGQPADLRRPARCCSTAGRTRPASRPATARSSTCRRPRARCARRSAPATCAACSATMGLGHVRYATKGDAAQRAGGAAVLRERAVRHRARAQRQPHEHARAHATSCSTSTAGTSTPTPTPSCWSTCSPTSCRRRCAAATSTPTRSSTRSRALHERVEGSYAAIALIAGHGPARLPRPVRHPSARPRHARSAGLVGDEWIVASESLVLESAGYEVVRDVAPGEAVFITRNGEMFSQAVRDEPACSIPCSFEYVYLARPDSIMNGISVYEARLRLGDRLADTIAKYTPSGDDRRRHADPRLVAPRRDAGRPEARHRVPRGLLQEPLRRPHVHHAGAGSSARRACSRSSTRCRASSRARTC